MWNDRLFMTREQMREYDRIAIEEVGIPGPVLMENAGRGAADIAARMLGKRRRLGVIAGPGNNGGDGYVIARHLINRGFEVNLYLAVPRNKIKGDARLNLDVLETMGSSIFEICEPDHLEQLPRRWRHDGFLVDALLGTGVSRDVAGHLGEVIDAMNEARLPVLAVDIPSGLDANTGRPRGKTVRAVATATFGHLKRGLLLHPGAGLAGAVETVSIGVPDFVTDRAGYDGELLSEHRVRSLFPARAADAHKGSFGHLLVLAGAPGKTGAAALTGRAAMTSGTGLVTIATTARSQPVIERKCLEAMVECVIEDENTPLDDAAIARIAELAAGKQALAVGPGLSTGPGAEALALQLLRTASVPTVVDADGINILARNPDVTCEIDAPLVLTPHPGEMARLAGITTAEVQADRPGTAREAARKHDAVIVLKGASTVIATPDGRLFVNPTGNPGMASGGTGDALTGLIGGLLAQGLTPLDAALAGAFLHGHAGDLAADRLGEAGLLASDLIDEIPGILKSWTTR